MIMRETCLLLTSIILLLIPNVHAQGDASPDETNIFATLEPEPDSTIDNRTPLLRVQFRQPAPALTPEVQIVINGLEMADFAEAGSLNETELTYPVSQLFKLIDGQNNFSVTVRGTDSEVHTVNWSVTYAIIEAPSGPPVTLQQAAGAGLIGLAAIAVFSFGFAFYLWKIRRYSWLKFRIRHPKQRSLLPLYFSLYFAALATLAAIYWITSGNHPPRFFAEYLVVAGLFIGFAPYAVDVHRSRLQGRKYERAYAQLLFELADALRGGIDPMKAILELAKTETGPLGPHLRVAADGVRLGRPFDLVMANLAKPLGSTLIERYAALVGEAAKVGGEIAGVVHRAARDLDELVKINEDRRRNMSTPVVTMYIAFGVLLWMVKSLLDFAPGLLSTDFAGSGLFGEPDPRAQRMSLDVLESRFFHLTLMTSLGSGLLVGAFTEGQIRHGLLHAFAMLAIAAVFFRVVVVGN